MAAYGPAVARIKYLLDRGPYQATPNTLSGSPDSRTVYSYRLPILSEHADGFKVLSIDTPQSPTTRRHIRAAHFALHELGYLETFATGSFSLYTKEGE